MEQILQLNAFEQSVQTSQNLEDKKSSNTHSLQVQHQISIPEDLSVPLAKSPQIELYHIQHHIEGQASILQIPHT